VRILELGFRPSSKFFTLLRPKLIPWPEKRAKLFAGKGGCYISDVVALKKSAIDASAFKADEQIGFPSKKKFSNSERRKQAETSMPNYDYVH
jgi:hypothetical protein